MQVTPITPLTPTECRLNRLDQCLLTNMELVAFMTIACPQVCMVTHPLDRIPLVERPLAEAPGLKSPGYCLNCLQDVNRWVRPRDWLLIPTYITAYTTLHYLFNCTLKISNSVMYRITEPFFKRSTFSWDFLVQHAMVLPIFDDVFDIWFISMPQNFLSKGLGRYARVRFYFSMKLNSKQRVFIAFLLVEKVTWHTFTSQSITLFFPI